MYVYGVEEQLGLATGGLMMILNHSQLTLSFFFLIYEHKISF